jgi:arylsulfatase A-like enzyme
MSRAIIIALVIPTAWLLASVSPSDAAPAARPNIVLIMADDMGYSDLGCYGGEIETPSLDALAADGLRFTQFYNTARCCPTRASLLTGLHPHQTGIGWMTNDPEDPDRFDQGEFGYRGFLNRNCVTIAEVLRPAEYQTLMVGKWHVGYARPELWPTARGFDRYYGLLAGAANYYRPEGGRGLFDGDQPVTIDRDDYYLTDDFTDHAVQFIAEAERDRPFFLYLAYTAPHWPLHAPEETIAKYRGKYDAGWDELRRTRYERMQQLGLIKPEWKLPHRAGRAWDDVRPAKQRDMAERMAIYAAQVDRMDQGIGRVVAALRAAGQLDNTLILFLSDNGGCAEGDDAGGGTHEQLNDREAPLFVTYGRCWANASNTPFRRFKHFTHEGGISTPLIAHWPAGIEDRGAWREQPGYLPDLMATFVELAGAEYPREFAGHEIPPLEGASLTGAFRNEPAAERFMFWEHEGHRAVRRGPWKAVSMKRDGDWELYNLAADRAEQTDLAKSEPEKLAELTTAWDHWSWRCHVQPYAEGE